MGVEKAQDELLFSVLRKHHQDLESITERERNCMVLVFIFFNHDVWLCICASRLWIWCLQVS